jgi:hypothetical protein
MSMKKVAPTPIRSAAMPNVSAAVIVYLCTLSFVR